MSRTKSCSVHRYFELGDSFVEVRVVQNEVLELEAPRRLDRSTYRRLVIQTCMPEFRTRVGERLEQLFPDDPMLAEDLLYQLCIDVNPQLEIHRVRLQSTDGAVDGARPDAAPATESAGREEFLANLGRRARTVERELKRRVFGQDHAVERVAAAVEKGAAGLSAPDRPLGSFFFVGRTGTGKTELARALAEVLFGRDARARRLLRIDCSEFGLAHEYSKLIGSPPGYVGHEDGGMLTEALQREPECVVVFDEVEKAHPKLHHLLLQVLEEGALTDGKGRRVSFDRTFVVLTSNAGAAEVQAATRAVGFHRAPALGQETLGDLTQRALQASFPPELLGRLDEVVVFRELGPPEARRIAQAHLTDLALRARQRGVRVAFTPAVARWVAEHGWSQERGARELRRLVQREIEPPLARLLLADAVGPESLVRARIRDGQPTFDVET